MRNREKRIRSLIYLIVSIVVVYMFICIDVMGKIGKLAQYMIYNGMEVVIAEHFDKYIGVRESEVKNIDEVILDEINNQMYGMNFLYEEGRKQALVSEKSNFLFENTEEDDQIVEEENVEETETKPTEEYIETIMPIKPENSITYSMEQLKDFNFLISHMYIVPQRAKVLESDLVAEEMLSKDMTIKGGNDKPQILVYHTHSQEAFADSIAGQEMTIVQVGDYLTELLRGYGFNVIHCTDSFDVDANGNLDRSNAYVNALPAVQQILEDNPSIEVVLDIHRDGLPEGVDKLVTNINGKETAKIMFFNGVSRSSAAGEIDYLYNRYRSENIALSFQAKLKAMEYYPDFTRKNYLDAYQYNLHVKDKAMLIEVGAQNNTFAEAKNAMEPLADILYMVFTGN